MTYLHYYEALCRDMTGAEQLEENALAFKEWRNSQRAEHEAYERWLTICGVRMETVAEYDTLAPVIPLPAQRVGEQLAVEGLE